MLFVVPNGGLIAGIPQEWLLNTPVLWLAALILGSSLRGPLRRAPIFLKKLLRFAVVTLFALGLAFLLTWEPVTRASKESTQLTVLWILASGLTPIGWIVASFRIFSSKRDHRRRLAVTASPQQQGAPTLAAPKPVANVPREGFADLGGMEEAKEKIRQVVLAQLKPDKYLRYGVLRNGILLYGPRGTGKTFLAKATAGEFSLHFEYVSAPKLLNRWIGATGENIQLQFAQAATRKPVLLFIDEIDALGTGRQDIGAGGDPGGAGREFNNITTGLMSAIDQYRVIPGFVLMAATNRLDGVDEAVIREGRFDVKIRIDLPDEGSRLQILEAQLQQKPCKGFDLQEFARKTPGASPAKLRALVDQAASYALVANRKIDGDDLRRSMEEAGGKDRPSVEPLDWNDVVIEESVRRELECLIQLLNDPARAQGLGLDVPTGLLLVGPPGVGKTLIARLIASQTRRSFYPLTPADVLGPGAGDSVKRIAAVFARAKEHNPSLIFFDEMDGLLPTVGRFTSQHDVQVVEQALTEISRLQSGNNVFLIGTANNAEDIDARVLRGGRFSEKIRILPPEATLRIQLLGSYLKGVRLEAGLQVKDIAELLDGFAPADLQAICTAAKRMAFQRIGNGSQLPPLTRTDFDQALARVRGVVA